MDTKEKELRAFSEKVMRGLKTGMRKMVEEKATRNLDLAIGDKNGNNRNVPAKTYLRTMK